MGLFGARKVKCGVCGRKMPRLSPADRTRKLNKSMANITGMAFQCRSCSEIVCFACSSKVTPLPGTGPDVEHGLGAVPTPEGAEVARAKGVAMHAIMVFHRGRATCPKCGSQTVGYLE
jgi:hypothetical protein